MPERDHAILECYHLSRADSFKALTEKVRAYAFYYSCIRYRRGGYHPPAQGYAEHKTICHPEALRAEGSQYNLLYFPHARGIIITT